MRRFSGYRLCAGLLLLATQLVGCGSTATNPDTAGSGSGVTVYGTGDAGAARTKR